MKGLVDEMTLESTGILIGIVVGIITLLILIINFFSKLERYYEKIDKFDETLNKLNSRLIGLEKNDSIRLNQVETLNKIVFKPFEESGRKK